MKEIGLYIHIPFCKSKCYYCDFTSFANKENLINEYTNCLKQELAHRADKGYKVKTIYIGGGTPSFIDACYIEEILNTVKEHYIISSEAEITIEANPWTVNEEKLKKYFALGINRLSIGLQSANNNLLKTIGRIHTYEQFEETIHLAKRQGFNNINSDMIIGLPNQTLDDVLDTAQKLINLKLTHISMYSLIVEEGTKIEAMLDKGELELPAEELERKMYWQAKELLEQNGFMQYEISNFAKAGYESKHNLDCWNQKEYLGFGVSSSSYEKGVRYSNTSCIEQYIENIQNEEFEKNKIIEEVQNEEAKRNEFMMLALRKIEGVSILDFENKFKQNPLALYSKELKKLDDEGLISIDNNNIRLSKKGIDLANLVWEEFV